MIAFAVVAMSALLGAPTTALGSVDGVAAMAAKAGCRQRRFTGPTQLTAPFLRRAVVPRPRPSSFLTTT